MARPDPKTEKFHEEIRLMRKWMEPHHKVWLDLLQRYDLDFESDSLPDEFLVKNSRLYPNARQLRAAIAFHQPHIEVAAPRSPYDRAAEVLEQFVNTGLRLIDAKREVHQILFDALFCAVGWGKMHYNPAGTDIEAPYVTNDEFYEDFTVLSRINPFNIFIDPLTPPHRLGWARFIVERMWVPLDLVKADDRFDKRVVGRLTPTPTTDKAFIPDMLMTEDDADQTLQNVRDHGDMVELWEVHDRMDGRRLMLSTQVPEQPLENEPHPYLKAQPVTEIDGFGRAQVVDTQPTGGYLVQSGFQYIPLKMDGSGRGFYPQPVMGYIADHEQIQVDSLSRRRDFLKRFTRQALVLKSEVESNPDLKEDIKNGEDGDLHEVNSLDSFGEIPWGTIPQDEMNLARDAKDYEEQILSVSDFVGGDKRTATAASLSAAAGAINREWAKEQVAAFYQTVATNLVRISGDPRYLPEGFIVNLSNPGGADEVELTLEAGHFLVDFHLIVHAGTMEPFAAQRNLENFVAFYDRALSHPGIDQNKLFRRLAEVHGEPNPDGLLQQSNPAQLERLIALENQLLAQGQDPGVQPEFDHLAHIKGHQQGEQDIVSSQPMLPEQRNLLSQAFQAHIAAHQQNMQQQASSLANGGTPAGPASSPLPPVPNSIESQVRSNAQTVSNEAADLAQRELS